MIFIDHSGKRWKKTKLAGAIAAGSIGLPASILFVASILAAPGWSPFSITQPVLKAGTMSGNGSPITQTSGVYAGDKRVAFAQPSIGAARLKTAASHTATSLTQEQTVGAVPHAATATSPHGNQQATSPKSYTTVVPRPLTNGTPPPASGSNGTGNSSYGKSHKPAGSGGQAKSR